ncbi:NDP-hexose 2,3-dehydratase family protein [Solwaraspora sp. WMMD406]|uniref:NDP-hexose 2,3-dehydratase family protein n=1 Tax=Solwaraspora sp. WMMD406 TaxID=3016095 RepID=UPI0024165473|nr:NDP-hexose 2,3-dehydratase family protein [Solwaraspora sp. WMMD406]MDG4765612.1 NDP-hexose 2,3-dehydratase family protein [Solwaraspora sp. WMMD406]
MTSRAATTTGTSLVESMLATSGRFARIGDFDRWLGDMRESTFMSVEQVALEDLRGWGQDPATGNLRHETGKFFTVESLAVDFPAGPVSNWSQPIINQPEIGILGILVKRIDGVLHCLMQAKREPGNQNGIQLAPTVQATRSNYTRVHQGRPVPYLDYFLHPVGHRVITDVRQSEQGAWFYQKRNRNMVVEVSADVPVLDGFCWLTMGQLHGLLRVPDLVGMDARTVLACLPLGGPGWGAILPHADEFGSALAHSCDPESGSQRSLTDILSWVTGMRSRTEIQARLGPLVAAEGWRRTDGRISHESGRFFDVMGVRVRAGGREVGQWMQPMIQPRSDGIIAFLVRPIDGVLHMLVSARPEPGFADVIELAPTVQCLPGNYGHLPVERRPPFLSEVLAARPEQVRFDAVLSEEGGRFYHARNRYLIVETDAPIRPDRDDYRWLTLAQLTELLQHSFYLNVQARSLVACLRSLLTGSPARPEPPR